MLLHLDVFHVIRIFVRHGGADNLGWLVWWLSYFGEDQKSGDHDVSDDGDEGRGHFAVASGFGIGRMNRFAFLSDEIALVFLAAFLRIMRLRKGFGVRFVNFGRGGFSGFFFRVCDVFFNGDDVSF